MTGGDESGDEDVAALADLQAKLMKAKWGNKLTDFGEFVEVFAELICASQVRLLQLLVEC